MAYTLVSDSTLQQALSLTQGDRETLQKLGAQLSPAARQAALAAAVQALPGCWGERSQRCSRGIWDAKSWGADRCRTIGYGYVADFDKFQGAINQLPYCDESAPLKYAALAGVVGVLFGLGVGALIAKR